MNIAFVNPPFLPKFSRISRSPAVTKSGTIYYPVWLAWAAGFAEERGHKITLIDAPAIVIEKEEVVKRLKDFKPDLVVMETSTGSIRSDASFTTYIKQHFPNAFTVLTGNHVTALHEETLKEYSDVDAIARKEYEETIPQLADVLQNKGSLSEVGSLTYRENGKIIVNPLREPLANLDTVPFASKIFKRFCNPHDYFFSAGRFPQVMIYTGRGCPYLCSFCVYPQNYYGHNYRHRSARNIADEFKYIEENFPEVVEVTIEDDTFTVYKKHTIELCQMLIEQKNKLTWTCNVRADLDYETMKWMKKAGCRLVIVGFESGSDKILKLMNKGVKVEQFKAAKNAKKAHLLVHACFMMGNKGETLETMEETLELAKKMNTDTAQFFPLMVYPGTEAYDWAKSEGLIRAKSYDDWLTPEGLHNTVVGTHDLTPEEIVEFCNYARREYYLRPAYLFMKAKNVLKNPGDIRRTIKAFFNFKHYLFARSNKVIKKKFDEKISHIEENNGSSSEEEKMSA